MVFFFLLLFCRIALILESKIQDRSTNHVLAKNTKMSRRLAAGALATNAFANLKCCAA
jgi:hypothetical protein